MRTRIPLLKIRNSKSKILFYFHQATVAGKGAAGRALIFGQHIHAAAVINPLSIWTVPGASTQADDTGHDLLSDPSRNADTALGAAHQDLLAATHAALAKLPPEQRVVVEMRLIGEMSYKEIAGALEIPMGTVMSRLNRGRRQLQTELRIEDPQRGPSAADAALDQTAEEAP